MTDRDISLTPSREMYTRPAWFKRVEDLIASIEREAISSEMPDIVVRQLGHPIHKLKAKDSKGRWAYYFILVSADREAAFDTAIKGDGTIDLEDYGKVVASCYSEQPNDEIKSYLLEKYGFEI